jgi:catechol 2,3-dioxygenase-like lactoylglutathione lyase family enzyme
MDYQGTLIAVKDMAKAKRFYHDVLGLDVTCDFGANVTLSKGLFLQTTDTWAAFIQKTERAIAYANNASELYFETSDMDGFINKLMTFPDIVYVHP